jgi:hypothetical protein
MGMDGLGRGPVPLIGTHTSNRAASSRPLLSLRAQPLLDGVRRSGEKVREDAPGRSLPGRLGPLAHLA